MAITRLRSIRAQVPSTIRAASARALAFARPPAPLVRLFAEEDLAISAPVLRMAELTTAEWTAMLPDMSPAARSVLRHRRDLSAEVVRALETYGPIDFILPPSTMAAEVATTPEVAQPGIAADPASDDLAEQPSVEAEAEAEPAAEAEAEVESEAETRVEFGADFLAALADLPAPLAVATPVAVDTFAAPATGSIAVPGVIDLAPAAAITPPPALQADQLPPAELYAEPLSIDWTDVLAARPAAPGSAVARLRPIKLPTMLPATPPPAPAPAPVALAATPERLPEPQPERQPEPTVAPIVVDILPSPIRQPARIEPAPTEPAPSEAVAQTGAMSFVSIASVAFGLPIVVEALRQQQQVAQETVVPEAVPEQPLALVANDTPVELATPEPAAPEPVAPRGPFQISDLVARIDAFQRQRDQEGSADGAATIANDIGEARAAPEGFSFETDARGVIMWVAGVSRAALIGVSLDAAADGGAARVDGVAAGAFRRRSAFAQARLLIDGDSDAAGQWRISGVPAFDRATGRFTGYRGTARRPRADERAEPTHGGRSPATDSLRQLVHELRTPTTAIAGFAEMIEGELLGPVPGAYRDYAGTIRDQAMGLLGAIDDLDTAARIEAHALDLRATDIPVALLLQRIALDLEPLAALRGAALSLDIAAGDVAIRGDDRAVDRLFGRLLAALVAAGSAGETIAVRMGREGDETVAIHIDRPRALAAYAGDALLTIDAEAEAEEIGAPLLGTGFALRLARNLAVELGGSLTIGVDRLTLRLPAAFTHGVGQASTI